MGDWGGGGCDVLPIQKKGGGGKSFSHAEGGHKRFWGSYIISLYHSFHVVA